MPEGVIDFLRGGTMVAQFAIGLYFLRFWTRSKDRLFAFFSASFFLMALSQKTVLLWSSSGDHSPYAYWIRLIAFLLIIAGIIEKNLPKNGQPN